MGQFLVVGNILRPWSNGGANHYQKAYEIWKIYQSFYIRDFSRFFKIFIKTYQDFCCFIQNVFKVFWVLLRVCSNIHTRLLLYTSMANNLTIKPLNMWRFMGFIEVYWDLKRFISEIQRVYKIYSDLPLAQFETKPNILIK